MDGQERWDANPDALKNLPKLRQLLLKGNTKAEELASKKGILGTETAESCCIISGSW